MQVFGQLEAVRPVFGQRSDMLRKGFIVARLSQKARHARLDDIRHAADRRCDRRAVHPRALGQRIRERLRKRGQRIDIDGAVKAVGVGDPSGKGAGARRT